LNDQKPRVGKLVDEGLEDVMIEKWLHLNFTAGSTWGYALVAAIKRAVDEGRVSQPDREQRQMPLYIATRIDMLRRVTDRINQEYTDLCSEVKKHTSSHVFTLTQTAHAFDVDEDLKFHLLVDIDSLMFEAYACCDITTKCVELVYNHIGKHILRKDRGKIIRNILVQSGMSIQWFVDLDNNRNFFSHNGTPYIAVDISKEEEDIYDLLIMKENLYEFTDEKKFIKLADLNRIIRGLIPAMSVIEKHLVSLYDSLPS
jgi:hypothetical protein